MTESVLVRRLRSLVGQPVAILSSLYWYRGILAEVDSSAAVLTSPRAVEVTGSATGAVPTTEDPIPSDVILPLRVVEIVCQPAWCFHEMRDA